MGMENAVACMTVLLAIACSVLDTLLEVRIHVREILVDLWSWPRALVMIPLSLLELSVMVWASAVRKEHQQSMPESPSTWFGLRQTWAKIQTCTIVCTFIHVVWK